MYDQLRLRWTLDASRVEADLIRNNLVAVVEAVRSKVKQSATIVVSLDT